MAEVIRMPRMSPTMEEGVIASWLKKVGDPVKVGDILCEVETDKATMELESFQAGTLLYIGVEKGAIQVDAILAILGKPGEDFSALLSGASAPAAPAATPAPAAALTAPAAAPTVSAPVAAAAPAQEDSRLKASPMAKSIAHEAGLDLHTVQGSGPEGRIIQKDVEAALSKAASSNGAATKSVSAPAPAPAPARSQNDIDTPVSQMRKTIARRLSDSLFTAPHFYLTMEINMDEASKARETMNLVAAPAKISFNDLVIKAVAMALKKHPVINSSWLGDTIRQNARINIGVAVAVAEGLLVPVIADADTKSLSDINAEVRDKATRAKDKKLGLEEMQGNTFTISNLGMFDIEEFTAIINPPDACILAVGSIKEVPVVRNGELAIGKVMRVTLSCDHRVVDGATGAQFLQSFKANLESPLRMLV